jgi:hypothetical protein
VIVGADNNRAGKHGNTDAWENLFNQHFLCGWTHEFLNSCFDDVDGWKRKKPLCQGIDRGA